MWQMSGCSERLQIGLATQTCDLREYKIISQIDLITVLSRFHPPDVRKRKIDMYQKSV